MALEISFYPYKLPLIAAWPGMIRNPMRFREGWVVKAKEHNCSGIGDCAPFQAFGTESKREAHRFLLQCAGNTWPDSAALLGKLEKQRSEYPASCFALETALLDLESRKADLPLRKMLNSKSSDNARVNALSGSICDENTLSSIESGFNVIKLKVGKQAVEEELACLKALCRKLPPQHLLRLDANGAWSLDEARYFLAASQGLPIESLEEPLRETGLAAFADLQNQTDITLALDESLKNLDLNEVLTNPTIRRLVLKPGVQGGLCCTLALAESAAAAGKESVITTLVDSAIGVQATCQLAAATDPLSPGLAHGLATSDWLSKDIAKPPEIRAGYVFLSDTPGLGIHETF
ncbi:MAG TPA: o-succinylbenzoate synthase [Thiolapillus brandeum]|uniref:o-succinylbenzoate synthase n=1 Tax=Thiolapillus brandeum TaxID=1076588 RepID=A0A831RXT4_9GAMM|nr:o-succinylbenzoate synthase [Thiolapillus brandeum]